jgi:ATP-dependent helicase/DNAse subunit B
MLDARQTGILLHNMLDHAVRHLESGPGFARASAAELIAAIDAAATLVSARWQAEQAVPPRVIWRRTLEDTRQTARQALQHDEPALAGQRCYTEVPFGGQEPKSDGALPWDVARPVTIPETGFRISGYIDRLDLSADGAVARVLDYKSGKLPKDDVILQGGAELQRCLYAFAVRALLGEAVTIHAALLYPHASETRRLAEPAAVLEALGDHLRAAHANLLAGCALIGPDNAGEYDDFAFALPANAGNGYCKRKREAAQAALGDATRVWEAV